MHGPKSRFRARYMRARYVNCMVTDPPYQIVCLLRFLVDWIWKSGSEAETNNPNRLWAVPFWVLNVCRTRTFVKFYVFEELDSISVSRC